MIYIAAISSFVLVIVGLSVVIIAIGNKLQGSAECSIKINDMEPFKAEPGQNLLNALAAKEIFIPSACGGQGTCFMCKAQVLEGGGQILPIEKTGLTRKEVHTGFRLACQVKVKDDLKLKIPEEIFNIKEYSAVVRSNNNVATFIKELVLDIQNDTLDFQSGDYIQINVPKYNIAFKDFDIQKEYHPDWDKFKIWDYKAKNTEEVIRAYSMANYPVESNMVKLNIRIATPPPGTKHAPGICSSYVFNLKAGDKVKISGPYGEFHIKETEREMCYLGGGAGMAPMRSHIFHLLKTQKSNRKISFWYGARSMREMFYHDEYLELAKEFPNFNYNVAMSDPLPEDNWTGPKGFIHQVCDQMYLNEHKDPTKIEYYLCGPPMMIDAVIDMLINKFEVPEKMIAYDKF